MMDTGVFSLWLTEQHYIPSLISMHPLDASRLAHGKAILVRSYHLSLPPTFSLYLKGGNPTGQNHPASPFSYTGRVYPMLLGKTLRSAVKPGPATSPKGYRHSHTSKDPANLVSGSIHRRSILQWRFHLPTYPGKDLRSIAKELFYGHVAFLAVASGTGKNQVVYPVRPGQTRTRFPGYDMVNLQRHIIAHNRHRYG